MLPPRPIQSQKGPRPSMLLKLYRRLRFREREFRGHVFKTLGMHRKVWSHGLFDEFQYWERALQDAHNPQSELYRERIDPNAPLQETFRKLITAPPGATVNILDVGAGPVTNLGKTWEGRQVTITPVDALSDRYDDILARLKIEPPVRTTFAHAERLSDRFAADTFDFAHARNSLDHSYDPV